MFVPDFFLSANLLLVNMHHWRTQTVDQLKLLNDTNIYPTYKSNGIHILPPISSQMSFPQNLMESFNQSFLDINIGDINKQHKNMVINTKINIDNENDDDNNNNNGEILKAIAGTFVTKYSINDEEYEDYNCQPMESNFWHLITMIMYTFVSVVGLFGNTLVIYVILRFSKMQTVTNIYILNLAIADECFLIGIPFLMHTMRNGSWTFGPYMCKAYMMSTSITQFTSSIFLLIMAADRYMAICHPISSPRFRTPWVSKIVSTGAWLTSALLMLPVLLFANIISRDGHVSCNIKWPETGSGPKSDTTFILYSLILGFATPLVFIMTFYCLVIRKLQSVGPKRKSKEKRHSHRKATTLVLTVITVYILCWMPYWTLQVVLIMSAPGKCVSRMEVAAFLFVSCLTYSNSAMNPILYAFLSENFKKSFMKAFSCSSHGKPTKVSQLQADSTSLPGFRKSEALGNVY